MALSVHPLFPLYQGACQVTSQNAVTQQSVHFCVAVSTHGTCVGLSIKSLIQAIVSQPYNPI